MKSPYCRAYCLLDFAFSCQATLAQAQPTNVAAAVATNLSVATSATHTNTGTKSLDFMKDAPAWVSNLIALVSLVVSAINLWVVVHFFFRSSSDRVAERDADRSERDARTTREVGNFWIQELILRTSNDFVHGFFDIAPPGAELALMWKTAPPRMPVTAPFLSSGNLPVDTLR